MVILIIMFVVFGGVAIVVIVKGFGHTKLRGTVHVDGIPCNQFKRIFRRFYPSSLCWDDINCPKCREIVIETKKKQNEKPKDDSYLRRRTLRDNW